LVIYLKVITDDNSRMTIQDIRRARLAQLIRERYDDSQASFVSQTGENQSEVSGLLKSKSFGEKKARKLEEKCGLPTGWLDTSDEQPDVPKGFQSVAVADTSDQRYVEIPKVMLRLSAGITGFETEPENFDGSALTVPRQWIERKGYDPRRLVAIKIRGESMETTLYEDDVVVINTADTRPVDGEVFAVNYEGEAVVKRLVRDAGSWWLASDNPDQRKYHRKICRGSSCIIVGKLVRRESDRA
jgi:phage repressor protein C with HTH and peptisase S24 domain